MLFSLLTQSINGLRALNTSACMEAARKCTRARKRAILLKNRKPITKKEAYAAEMKRKLAIKMRPKLFSQDIDQLPVAVDDVFCMNSFRPLVFDLDEALAMHRAYYHPTLYNNSEAFVSVTMELDLTMDKRNKFMPKFNGVTPVPHPFLNLPKRSVLVLAKSDADKLHAIECGADKSGATEVVKQFQEGALSFTSFSYVVVHTDMAADIAPLRGILKNRFPTVANGLVTGNIAATVSQFQYGIEFDSELYAYQSDYGTVTLPFGRLSMDNRQLRANLAAMLNYVESRCPRSHSRPLITRAKLWCQKDKEMFFVKFASMMLSDKYSAKKEEVEGPAEVCSDASESVAN